MFLTKRSKEFLVLQTHVYYLHSKVLALEKFLKLEYNPTFILTEGKRPQSVGYQKASKRINKNG